MRRLAAILAAVLVIAYSVFWWIAAGKIEEGVALWADNAKAQGLTASWQAIRVGGYPLAFRVELTEPRLDGPEWSVAAPGLTATIQPWSFHSAALAAPQGLSGKGGDIAAVTAASATGNVAADSDGTDARIELDDVKAAPVAAKTARFRLVLPPQPPRGHTDLNFTFSGDVKALTIPIAPKPLGDTIDDVGFGFSAMGPVPPGKTPRDRAAAWRDEGGTVELSQLHVGWGAVGIDASGTLALDRDLQPVGSLTGALSGYDELLAALVAAGQIRESDSRTLKFVLRALAKNGRIETALSVQNGKIYVGPASLGRVPKIPW